DRGVFRRGSGSAAKARHEPRRLRLLRAPLRDPGRRRRHPVADDAGAALGRRPGQPDPARPARAREGHLPRELAEPPAGRHGRTRDRRVVELLALRRHARAGRLAGRDVPRHGERERGRAGTRPHWRAEAMPGELALLEVAGLATGYGWPPVLEEVTFD